MNKTANRQQTLSRATVGLTSKRIPKFRKASKEEIARSVENYHAILAEMEKLGGPPCDAIEMVRYERGDD